MQPPASQTATRTGEVCDIDTVLQIIPGIYYKGGSALWARAPGLAGVSAKNDRRLAELTRAGVAAGLKKVKNKAKKIRGGASRIITILEGRISFSRPSKLCCVLKTSLTALKRRLRIGKSHFDK